MRHMLLQLSYLGGAYAGFQVQQNAVTVQQTLQDALERLLGQRPPVKGCSRTDAGVHAARYYCTVPFEKDLPEQRIPAALNAHLPGDISVLAAREVAEEFHPRYMARAKRYQYRWWLHRSRNVFLAATSCHHPAALDADTVIALAPLFEGRYDFAGFQSSGSAVADTVRTIHRCEAVLEDRLLTLTVVGDGFLYNMVRIMAGTLAAAAKGGDEDIAGILASRERGRAGPTAPAHGLTLMQVYYQPGTTGLPETEVPL